MADNRTGLSPADIAESFRDRCGDGSVEWVYTPTQTRVLLDAADMLDENAKLRELVRDMYACIEALCSMVENSPGCSMCLTNQDEEKPCAAADVYCRMRELGVEV